MLQASTQDVIKPSNIRKRNFSASLVQSVSQEEKWEGIPDPSNNIGVPPDQKHLEEKKTVVNEEIKGERARGAIARDVSVIVPKKAESDWERSRISVRRGPSHETSSTLGRGGQGGGGGGSLGGRGGVGLSRGQPKPAGDSKQEQPRRRIRLNRSMMRKAYHHHPCHHPSPSSFRSKLGIYQMVQSTTRSPRQDDDTPQRPSKRDRIRNLKIRRPVNSNVNSTQPAASQHPSLAAKSGIGGQARVSSTSRIPTSSSTRGTTTTERMLSGRLEYQDIVRTTKAQQFQDNVEYQDIVRTTKARQYPDEVEYQDIVRTTPMQEPTKPSTVVVRTKPTTTTKTTTKTSTTKPITTSSERTQPIRPVSTTELFQGTEPSTSTLRSSTKEAEPTQVTKSTTYQGRSSSSSSPDLTKSTLAMPESTTTESSSSESSTISQSVLATPAVTPIDGSDGSLVKQSSEDGVRISNEDQTQSEITTRNPVELPSRPREELKQDLLEAIRRKISRNKVSSSSSGGVGQKSETGFEISSQPSDLNRTPSSVLPKSSSLRAVRLATSSFSPAFNSVSSTRPPFFRPISFPPRSSGGKLDIPKVTVKMIKKLTLGIGYC